MPEKIVKTITTLKEIRVINDPYRREILTSMALMDRPATAKEIAVYMDEPPSKVNYHVGILHKYGFIDLHHTKNINGIIAKFFNRSLAAFKIKMEGPNAKSKEIAALRDIVASTFDLARDQYITSLAESAECEEDENCEDRKEYEGELLFSRQVYLNNQELKMLWDLTDKVADNKKEGRKLYSFFTSYIELDKNTKK